MCFQDHEIVEERPIYEDGKIKGYRQYCKEGAIIGGLHFHGYRWIGGNK